MKRLFGILLTLVLTLTCFGGTTAFAAGVNPNSEVATVSKTATDEITPRGTLSGYGQVWHEAGTSCDGSFYVDVTGSSWLTAQVTFNIENFGPNDAVAVWLYRPDGSFAWGTLDNSGGMITMANKDDWQNIKFSGGQTGRYIVQYSIVNFAGQEPGSGRINCWIY